jgi:hypothetical protein
MKAPEFDRGLAALTARVQLEADRDDRRPINTPN